MYFEHVSKISKNCFLFQVLGLVTAIFLFSLITAQPSQAQSYQQRQLIKKYRYQQQKLAQKQRRFRQQQRRRRVQPKKQTILGSFFGETSSKKQSISYQNRIYPKKRSHKRSTRKKRRSVKAPQNILDSYSSRKKTKTPASFRKKRKARKGGGRRPMCVRLCDGFYWPVDKISASAKRQNNKTFCQNSCSASTRVYYAGYSGDGDTATSMHDLRGNRYKDLKNAFVYRKTFKRTCQCKPAPWSEAAKRIFEKRDKETQSLLGNISGNKKKSERTATLRKSL